MTEINCAQNNKLAEELTIFLQNEDYSVTQENDLVTVDKKLSKSILELFLKKTGRIEHKRADHAADEINALLNYGYSILASEIKKFLNSVGLDSQIGFLHETLLSRTPLVYDLQELFRWLIDLSVIELLEESNLKKSDFILTENYHIRLKQETAKLLVEKIKSNFNLKVSYGKKYFAYQNILNSNISQLAQFISEKKKTLEFKVPPIKINRDDNLLLREKILAMTPAERKKLGIAKSTLWYLKKNVLSKDKIKIYDKILEKLSD